MAQYSDLIPVKEINDVNTIIHNPEQQVGAGKPLLSLIYHPGLSLSMKSWLVFTTPSDETGTPAYHLKALYYEYDDEFTDELYGPIGGYRRRDVVIVREMPLDTAYFEPVLAQITGMNLPAGMLTSRAWTLEAGHLFGQWFPGDPAAPPVDDMVLKYLFDRLYRDFVRLIKSRFDP